MKRVSMALLIVLAPAAVMAHIIPTVTTVTGANGSFTWSYGLQLSSDHDINSGLPPTANPRAHDNRNHASFLTIFDFAGYIPGSCTGPSGWVCMVRSVGFTPDDVAPFDDPSLPNLTWVYLTGPTIPGRPGGVDLGGFSARSSFDIIARLSFAARGLQNTGSEAGAISDSVGHTQGPTANAIPEPSAAALAGLGLLIMGWNSRSRISALRRAAAGPTSG